MDEGIVHIISRASDGMLARCVCEAYAGLVRVVNPVEVKHVGWRVAGSTRWRGGAEPRDFD